MVPTVVNTPMHCAVPEASVTAPHPLIVVTPFLKLTVPVGALPVTVTVKVTLSPAMLGEPLVASEAVVGTLGITLLDAADEAPVPVPFVAATTKLYAVPLTNPTTLMDVQGAMQLPVIPSGEDVAV